MGATPRYDPNESLRLLAAIGRAVGRPDGRRDRRRRARRLDLRRARFEERLPGAVDDESEHRGRAGPSRLLARAVRAIRRRRARPAPAACRTGLRRGGRPDRPAHARRVPGSREPRHRRAVVHRHAVGSPAVVARPLALAGGGVGLTGLVGYLYSIVPFYGIRSYTQMAVHTAAAFVVLAAGILPARADQGIMATLTMDGAGGRMGRRFMPAAIAMPVVLGWFILHGGRAGFYSAEFG